MDELFEKLLAEDLVDLLKKHPNGLRRHQIAEELKKGEIPLPPFLDLAYKVRNNDAVDQIIRGALNIACEDGEVERLDGGGNNALYKMKPAIERLANI